MAKSDKITAPVFKPSTQLEVFRPKENSRHSNILINSRHEYSALEKKMIYCMINQLAANMAFREDLFGDIYFKIPVSTFGEDYSYTHLKSAVKKIHSRVIEVDEGGTYHIVNPIGEGWVRDGHVELKLQCGAIPYFMDLKRFTYTTLQFQILIAISGVYAQRMYEMLRAVAWKKEPVEYMDVEHLKYLLAVNNKPAYKKYSNFINVILKPAQKEVEEKTDITFTYEPSKKVGGKIVELKFTVCRKKDVEQKIILEAKNEADSFLYDFSQLPPTEQATQISKAIMSYSFTEDQRKKILNSERGRQVFVEYHVKIQMEVIKVRTTPTKTMAWYLQQAGVLPKQVTVKT